MGHVRRPVVVDLFEEARVELESKLSAVEEPDEKLIGNICCERVPLQFAEWTYNIVGSTAVKRGRRDFVAPTTGNLIGRSQQSFAKLRGVGPTLRT